MMAQRCPAATSSVCPCLYLASVRFRSNNTSGGSGVTLRRTLFARDPAGKRRVDPSTALGRKMRAPTQQRSRLASSYETGGGSGRAAAIHPVVPETYP
jgi:hypothetical protein